MVFLVGTIFLLIFAACGGGGGGGSDDATTASPSPVVTDDGGANSPIPNGSCRFVDTDRTEHDTDVCDANGRYELNIPSGMRGYVLCIPQSVPDRALSTFTSTLNHGAGSTIAGENVTPATTVAADIIRNENPADPEGRKAQLITDMVTGQDANLELVAVGATAMSTMAASVVRPATVRIFPSGRGGECLCRG